MPELNLMEPVETSKAGEERWVSSRQCQTMSNNPDEGRDFLTASP